LERNNHDLNETTRIINEKPILSNDEFKKPSSNYDIVNRGGDVDDVNVDNDDDYNDEDAFISKIFIMFIKIKT
jgi:hypothetical protein